ncbi:hypothetical protein ACHAPT_008318 [Fusarium lateritium]
MLLPKLFAFFASLAQAAPAQNARTAVLDILIPDNPVRDTFYTVDLDFQGQRLPMLLDTGSADIVVASTECSNTDESSGCYKSKRLELTNDINIIANETFYTIIGTGSLSGNQSFMDVGFGSITLEQLATPLVFKAAKEMFQNGSFSGILGMGMLAVSREYLLFNQLPPFNAMARDIDGFNAVYSVSVPRYGDPDSPKSGKLTIGAVENSAASQNLSYGDVVPTPNYNEEDIAEDKTKFLSIIDTGGTRLHVGFELFRRMTPYLNGNTFIIEDFAAFFDCAIPQLIEFKYNNQWIPIDPLDMILPGEQRTINGTLMCMSAIQRGGSGFGDSVIGPQFFRNALAVFDLQPLTPRVGFAPLTDANRAVERYPDLYKNRLS